MATAEPTTRNLAELVARLGGVPLDRIRARPAPGTATEEDLLEAGKPICELIDGVLVEKPMGNRESILAAYISELIRQCVRPDDLGTVVGEAGFFRVTPDQVRAADVAYVPWSAFPGGAPPVDDPYWSVSPGLVVEVLSPSNTPAEMERKRQEFFSIGTKVFWLVDPDTRTVKVYTTVRRFKEFDEAAVLDGGKVVPGLKFPLADLFAEMRPRKKKPR